MDAPDPRMTAAIEALAERHYAVIPDYLSPDLLRDLRTECEAMHAEGLFHAAGIGRGAGQHRNTTIRGDSICWLEETFPAGGRYLALMEQWRNALNRTLFLGLRSYESHYAHYEPGSFYRKHVDRHRDNDARTITTVCYLNADWPAGAGGEIRLYHPNDGTLMAQLEPLGGTLVVFTSNDIPHEVLPARRARLSLAGWFRRD